MRILFVVVLVAVVLAQDPEDCLKVKCKTEYDTCKGNFVCATKGLQCQNKCGPDEVCQYDCAVASGNEKLIALSACGKEKCKTTETLCESGYCTNEFFRFCENASWQTIGICRDEFFTMYPQCGCVEKL
ncbi:hypothetical protein pb186bvf_001531 [Paramecium bursaria]